MATVDVRLSPADLAAQVGTQGVALYRKASQEKKTFSQLMEEMSPSGADDKLDAFERMLQALGIRVHSDPNRGLWADTCEKFLLGTDSTRALFPEYINRTAREALMAPPMTGEFIALYTGINAGSYTAYQIEDQPDAQQLKRVTEFGQLARTRLKGKEVNIKLSKHGRVVEASYEYLRRVQIPMLSILLRRIGLQTDLDRVMDIIDVIVNGDGNSNSAINYNKTALQGGQATDKLNSTGWLGWLMKFFPHRCTTVAGGEAELLQVITLQFPNVDPMTILAALQDNKSVQARIRMPQNIYVNVTLLLVDGAPPNKLIGIDREFAIEQVAEIGADITETEKVITSQFERFTVSETTGYSKILKEATATLTLNA